MLEHRTFWERLQVGVIAAMLLAVALRWNEVPDRIPIHWNAAGEVDGYGGRFAGLLLIPVVTLALYLVLRYIPRIDPLRANYERFAGAYLTVRVLLTLYLAFVAVIVNLAIGNEDFPVGELIVGAVGVMFIVLGLAMPRFRPNWFAGIRTPWTLSSDRAWAKTHVLGGRVFVAAGLATMVGAVIGPEWAIGAMFGVMLPGVVWAVVYSYFVWRDDPERGGHAGRSQS